jgi:hypothetical protein
MDDATFAKDLLLGKNKIQMRRFKDSSCIKFFMRPSKGKWRDKWFLLKLAKYLARIIEKSNKKFVIHNLDVPDDDRNDFLVLEIACTTKEETDGVQQRWEQYEEVAFGGV